MASTINFKRLVQIEAVHVIEDIADTFRSPVLLVDSAKRTLWGDEQAKTLGGEFPVWLAGRILGYVLGAPQAYCIASLLSHLSQQELEKREAMEKVLDKEAEITLIQEIHSKLGASLDVAEIAMALVDEASSTVESTGASVMLLNEDTGRLEIAAAFGRKMNDRPVLKPGVGIVGDVLLTGIPEVVPDVSRDPRYVPGAYPVCSLICVPIAASGKVIGAINISNQRPVNYGGDGGQACARLGDPCRGGHRDGQDASIGSSGNLRRKRAGGSPAAGPGRGPASLPDGGRPSFGGLPPGECRRLGFRASVVFHALRRHECGGELLVHQ